MHGLTRFSTRDPEGVKTLAVYTAHPDIRPFFNPRHGLNDRFYSACFVFFLMNFENFIPYSLYISSCNRMKLHF